MTAEVALINRVAVALAADSAMTLSGGVTDKIYNSADKIFELSRYDPVGMMIFNNLDFMGVPLDVATKLFRDTKLAQPSTSLNEIADTFFDFLRNGLGISPAQQERHVERLSRTLFNMLRGEFEKRVEREIANAKESRHFDFHKVFLSLIEQYTTFLKQKKVAAGFECVNEQDVLAEYDRAIEIAAKAVFSEYPLDADDLTKMRSFVAEFIRHDVFSSVHTGLVFAGYGKGDLFPSLKAFDTDGIFCGRLKCRKTKDIVIDNIENTAEIVPFAQHDMADRFLYGIDPDFEEEIPGYLEAAVRKVGESIIRECNIRPKARRAEVSAKLNEAIQVTAREFRKTAVPSIKAGFKRQIHAMVSFMPKQELANFAESMINITSIKRKVSAEQESVGGPVDVAVISRSDGFIWVRRKHYFDRNLNPRYFFRKFSDPSIE